MLAVIHSALLKTIILDAVASLTKLAPEAQHICQPSPHIMDATQLIIIIILFYIVVVIAKAGWLEKQVILIFRCKCTKGCSLVLKVWASKCQYKHT